MGLASPSVNFVCFTKDIYPVGFLNVPHQDKFPNNLNPLDDSPYARNCGHTILMLKYITISCVRQRLSSWICFMWSNGGSLSIMLSKPINIPSSWLITSWQLIMVMNSFACRGNRGVMCGVRHSRNWISSDPLLFAWKVWIRRSSTFGKRHTYLPGSIYRTRTPRRGIQYVLLSTNSQIPPE